MSNIYTFDPTRKKRRAQQGTASNQELETVQYAPVDERNLEFVLHGALITLKSFQHPADYVQRQAAGDEDPSCEDLLGTDKYPLLEMNAEPSVLESIERWREKFNDHVRIWSWDEADSTMYDPTVYRHIQHRFPYAELIRTVEESNRQCIDAYEEKMNESWIDACKDDEDAMLVIWSMRKHIILQSSAMRDEDGTLYPALVHVQLGWPDMDALTFAIETYANRQLSPSDKSLFSYALNLQFTERQDRK